MSDFEFIQACKNFSVSKICDSAGVNYSNLVRGTSTKENEKKIAELLKWEIIKIYSLMLLKE